MLTEKEPKQIPARCGKKKLTEKEPTTTSRQMLPEKKLKQYIPPNPAMVVEQQIQTNAATKEINNSPTTSFASLL
jgi:hypothetical protein